MTPLVYSLIIAVLSVILPTGVISATSTESENEGSEERESNEPEPPRVTEKFSPAVPASEPDAQTEDQQESDQQQNTDDNNSESTSDGGEEDTPTPGQEKCSIGLHILKSMIDEGNASADTINLYNEQARSDEIAAYIQDNIDEFDLPDWFSDSGVCLIADSVVEEEQTQNRTFEGSELNDAILLHSLQEQGEIANKVLR